MRTMQAKHIINTVLMCLLPAVPVLSQEITRSQEVMNRFKFSAPPPEVVVGLFIFFGTALAILVSLHLNTRRKHNATAQEVSQRLFNEGSARCELTDAEAAALRAIAAFAPDSETKGHEVFDVAVLFERCVEAYAVRLLRAGNAGDEADDLLRAVRRKLGFGSHPADMPLMSTRNLSVAQGVSVVIPAKGANPPHPVGGEVVRVGEFTFTVRLTDAGDAGAQPGADMAVTFLRQGDAAYSVPAKVHSLESGRIVFYHTLKFSRSQNRKYMRMEASLPLAYKVTECADPEKKPTQEAFKARSADISGGGLCFIADTAQQAGDLILLSIQIPGYSMGGITAKILKVITIEGRSATQYKHLTQFVTIEPQQRERIVRFIFEKQREMLQMR